MGPLTLADIHDEQLRLAKAGSAYLIGYVLIYTATYSVFDIYFYDADAANLILTIVMWGLGFALLVGVMKAGGLLVHGMRSGLGTYFGLGLLISFAVTFGLFLLLLPGLYLMMRWLSAYARAVTTDEGAVAAMRWSWHASQPAQMPLSIALLPPVAIHFAAFGALFTAVPDAGSAVDAGGALILIAVNAAIYIASAWLTLLGVAVYGLQSGQMDQLIDTLE
ncbi:hypothetical protein [Erythrobacter sp. MTPC3]|uniref:hypothetical protein n=1 Tax=Erythrobacter sp. MTPC3 TaxID=3056564 RepID=UPI0036F3CCC3